MRVVVATFANVLTPEKYGILPTTAGVEVESPPNVTVFAVFIRGQVNASVACLLLNVFQSVEERHPAWLPEAVWQPKEPVVPMCVKLPVRGEVAVRVEVATLANVFTPEK